MVAENRTGQLDRAASDPFSQRTVFQSRLPAARKTDPTTWDFGPEYHCSENEQMPSTRHQAGVAIIRQAFDNTTSFSLFEFAAALYTMAHRLLRLR
jgi:hypothetical protein